LILSISAFNSASTSYKTLSSSFSINLSLAYVSLFGIPANLFIAISGTSDKCSGRAVASYGWFSLMIFCLSISSSSLWATNFSSTLIELIRCYVLLIISIFYASCLLSAAAAAMAAASDSIGAGSGTVLSGNSPNFSSSFKEPSLKDCSVLMSSMTIWSSPLRFANF